MRVCVKKEKRIILITLRNFIKTIFYEALNKTYFMSICAGWRVGLVCKCVRNAHTYMYSTPKHAHNS